MRKIIIAMLALATMTATAGSASAQYREHRYAPRYSYQRNWVPYAVGGLALGVLGGVMVNRYYEPQHLCRRVVVDQAWNGYRWVSITEVVCD